METKVCTRCKIEQPVSNYSKMRGGTRYWCRKCVSETAKLERINNPEKWEEQKKYIREYMRNLSKEKRYENNLKKRAWKRGVSLDMILEEEKLVKLAESQNKKYCYDCCQILDKSCFVKLRIAKDGLNTTCKECRKKKSSGYYSDNKEKIYEKKKVWLEKNKAHVRKRYNNYVKNRMSNDYMFKLCIRLRQRLQQFLKIREGSGKVNTRTIDMIGCSVNELKVHLENQFTEGMCWENYGNKGWHIDHIIPLSSAKTKEEAIALNNYKNLQPLWAVDNLKKGKKLLK